MGRSKRTLGWEATRLSEACKKLAADVVRIDRWTGWTILCTASGTVSQEAQSRRSLYYRDKQAPQSQVDNHNSICFGGKRWGAYLRRKDRHTPLTNRPPRTE